VIEPIVEADFISDKAKQPNRLLTLLLN
jgi:hypothetical protein